MRLGALAFILISFIAGCSKPSLIDEDKFVIIYTDLIIAQDTSLVPDNNFLVIKEKVFNKHGVTEKEYIETLDYYNENPQRWDQFFNKAIERLERLNKVPARKP